MVWYCDRQRIYAPGVGLPAGCGLYKTYSLYYSAGCGIFVLPLDATAIHSDEWRTWKPLRFEHSPQDYSSSLTEAGSQPGLSLQRTDQQWPRVLLPDIYHAPSLTGAGALNYGGLTGELPILLGLYALSTCRTWLQDILPRCFQAGAWRVHQHCQPSQSYSFRPSGQLLTIAGQHQRGVVVNVYTCPPSWSGGSTANNLGIYENGALGKYLN
jgi:hypothetical protein